MGLLKEDLSRADRELIETHTAWVWLDRTTAYKVKKPVDLGFLDYSTVEKRRAACNAEVRLNARLAPDVYQGVVPIMRDGAGRHALAGVGKVVDYAVKMVRLPDAERADVLLERGGLSPLDVERIAEHVAAFHERAPTSAEISELGTEKALVRNVRENFDQTRATIGAHVSESQAQEIEKRQLGFIDENASSFAARIGAGRIRDCHGDLRLEHVYLSPGAPPKIIDCIEFNERFRYSDVAADVAFLSMDLERFGRADLAERFLAAYARASGDYDLYPLIDFYEGYRAYVRGKVASILSLDSGAPLTTRQRAASDARRYYLLALAEGRPRLLAPAVIAVGGIIASGKSTIAEKISAMTSAPIVDADRTRKALLDVPATTHVDSSAWSGAYAPDVTARVYDELLRRAECVLASGRPVVVEASFRSQALRLRAREVARRRGVPFHFVECQAPLDECRRRLETRRERPTVSDGRLEIFDAFVAEWEGVVELPESEHVVLDTSRPLEANLLGLREVLPLWPQGFNG